MARPAGAGAAAPPKLSEEQENVVKFLYSKVPYMQGYVGDKIYRFVRGDYFTAVLVESEDKEFGFDKIKTEDDAVAYIQKLLELHPPHAPLVLAPVEKAKFKDGTRMTKGGRQVLKPLPGRTFDPKARYAWVYTGEPEGISRTRIAVITGIILACILFPVWPTFLRVVVWYMSVTFLLGFFGFLIIRYTLALLAYVIGAEFWIMPNFFDESLGFWDSLKPVFFFAWHGFSSEKWMRLVAFVAILGTFGWFYFQPTEFDAFLATQEQFVEDLYAGTLLTDGMELKAEQEEAKHNFGAVRPKKAIPSLEDLENMDTDAVEEVEGEEGEDGDEDMMGMSDEELLEMLAAAGAIEMDEDEEAGDEDGEVLDEEDLMEELRRDERRRDREAQRASERLQAEL